MGRRGGQTDSPDSGSAGATRFEPWGCSEDIMVPESLI